MSAYNRILGVPCSASRLLTEVLRDEWKFDDYVVSIALQFGFGSFQQRYVYHR